MTTADRTFAWVVPADHPAFPGHFPGRPILPGVVLLDQAVRFAAGFGCSAAGCRIASAKFFSPVEPGETVEFALAAKAGGSVHCDIRSGGRAVAVATLTFPA